jgi:hypothetical protein
MKRKLLLASLFSLMLTVSAFAKFWGWDTEWTYLKTEGDCVVKMAVQHYYVLWIDTGGDREVEVDRNCL